METLEQHLWSRFLDTSLHRAWLDHQERIVTFPLWNLNGQLVGYQQYRPDVNEKKKKNDPKEGRYYTYLPRRQKSCCGTVTSKVSRLGVWGLESFCFKGPLFIQEGVFDAARLTYFRAPAIALTQNDPNSSLENWLYCISKQRPLVFVCDNDKGGMFLRKTARRLNQSYEIVPTGDLGNAPEDYVLSLLGKYGD